MNEQKNNGRGIFYGVIGVATLVVAIIGATFAYFTATASNNTVITGNMATIEFGLAVTKVTTVDDTKGGMIPMSNTMVHQAVSNASTKGVCVDDNGNAVCQIYKIDVTNTGSASLFLDGYVSLVGGSGTPADYKTYANASTATTMRWAQVFVDGDKYTTAGKTTTGALGSASAANNISGIDVAWAELGADSDTDTTGGLATDRILTEGNTGTGYISGNDYPIINQNYIRVSDHDETSTSYDRTTDVTSALVYNQYLDAESDELATDAITYYIVVWLSETGTDQTADDDEATANPSALEFFTGNVTFNSAQGSEVTATFSGYAAVPSDQLNTDEDAGE